MSRDSNTLDLGTDLAHALDAVAFAEDRLGFVPDDWQAELLRSDERQIIENICRQAGKSTSCAVKALHAALYDPGLVLLVSPSLRQSRELFSKVVGFLRKLEPAEILQEDNKSSCTLSNGSRIVSLPGDPDTTRGYSGPRLIIADEASRISPEMFSALRPMLATSAGQLLLLSTPAGRQGYFYEVWHHGQNWQRFEIMAKQCPRISQDFLDTEMRELGPMLYSQEYECQFIDADAAAFSSDLIELCLVDDFEAFVS